MKRILLAVAIAVSFLTGFGVAAEAWPVGGRNAGIGYFLGNGPDTNGWEILPSYGPSGPCTGDFYYNNGVSMCNAFPLSMDTAAEFTSFVIDRADGGYTARELTGASFIIHTMIGTPIGQRSRPPTAAQINVFVNFVYQYEAAGLINWYYDMPAGNLFVNSLWQGAGSGGNWNDDAFYSSASRGAIIAFNHPGGGSYIIRRECANPVANNDVPPLQQIVNYSISGYTEVDNPNPSPGQDIVFSHWVRNNGPTSTTPNPIWWVSEITDPAGVPSANSGGPAPWGIMAPGLYNVYNEPAFRVPLTASSGTQYCRRVGWDPTNPWGGGPGRGSPKCAIVAANYTLQPFASVTADNAQEGDVVTFTFSIDNTGANDSPNTITCTVTGTQPAGVPAPPTTSCPRAFPQAGGAITVATQAITIGNQPAGSRICRTLTVNPATAGGAPASSPEVCVTIVKTPYVHFLNGDVWAGGGFSGVAPGTCNANSVIRTKGRTLSSGELAGSGTTSAAFAMGLVTQFGSGSRVLTAPAAVLGKSLTFSNLASAGLGYFGSAQHCVEDYVNKYSTAPALASGAINLNTAGSGQWQITGSPTFSGAMPAGARKVFLVNGSVTITGPITYPASYSSESNIPSLVIIATGDIRVNAAVTDISGLYVSRGTFYTCNPKTEPAVLTTCDQQLNVHGAVIARYLDLHRTAGASGPTVADRQRPAEVFTMDSEIFFNNALNQTAQPTITVIDSREVPPRF